MNAQWESPYLWMGNGNFVEIVPQTVNPEGVILVSKLRSRHLPLDFCVFGAKLVSPANSGYIFTQEDQNISNRQEASVRATALMLFLMMAVLLWTALGAQSSYFYSQEINDQYSSRSIFLCSDNSVVILGNDAYVMELHMYSQTITKLDPQGNLLWRAVMGVEGSITGVDIDSNDNVTFITTNPGIRLWSINRFGAITPISDEQPLPRFNTVFNRAVRLGNGDIVAVGSDRGDVWYFNYSACYFRFSSYGEVMAQVYWTAVPYPANSDTRGFDLTPLDNGNVLIACSWISHQLAVVEVSPDAQIVNNHGFPGRAFGSAVTIDRIPGQQNWLVAYNLSVFPFQVNIDVFNGTTITPLFAVADTTFRRVTDVMLSGDRIYLCGTTYAGGRLLCLDYQGNVLWSRDQQGENMGWACVNGLLDPSTHLLQRDDDGCVYWAWGNYGTQTVTKLLPNGQVDVDDEVLMPGPVTMTLYPNPMKDKVQVKLSSPAGHSEIVELMIYNIRGQHIRSVPVSGDEAWWDGKDRYGRSCPSGVYLISVPRVPLGGVKVIKIR